MGTYTELVLAVELKCDTPSSVIEDIQSCVDGAPNCKFDWFHCDSCYFPNDSAVAFRFDEIKRCWSLKLRCNLKNYHSAIDAFCEWLCDHVHIEGDGFAGHVHHEDFPAEMIYFTKEGVVYVDTENQ